MWLQNTKCALPLAIAVLELTKFSAFWIIYCDDPKTYDVEHLKVEEILSSILLGLWTCGSVFLALSVAVHFAKRQYEAAFPSYQDLTNPLPPTEEKEEKEQARMDILGTFKFDSIDNGRGEVGQEKRVPNGYDLKATKVLEWYFGCLCHICKSGLSSDGVEARATASVCLRCRIARYTLLGTPLEDTFKCLLLCLLLWAPCFLIWTLLCAVMDAYHVTDGTYQSLSWWIGGSMFISSVWATVFVRKLKYVRSEYNKWGDFHMSSKLSELKEMATQFELSSLSPGPERTKDMLHLHFAHLRAMYSLWLYSQYKVKKVGHCSKVNDIENGVEERGRFYDTLEGVLTSRVRAAKRATELFTELQGDRMMAVQEHCFEIEVLVELLWQIRGTGMITAADLFVKHEWLLNHLCGYRNDLSQYVLSCSYDSDRRSGIVPSERVKEAMRLFSGCNLDIESLISTTTLARLQTDNVVV